jgi:RNA polymerase sigma-70 factor (ECF subfamily)
VAPENTDQPLNRISTLWSLVCRAHQAPAEQAHLARRQLLERYGGAVQRYLRRLLGDADAANDVFQEFALCLVHGELGGADPQRGRFRNFVKGTLFHLVADHRKRQQRWPRPLPEDAATVLADSHDADADNLFASSWCDELLARAWASLAAETAATGQPYYEALRCRAEQPDLRSPQLAVHLGDQLGRPFTAVAIRQILHRARERFAALLLEEVAHSLDDPGAEQLEQELVELGLLEYCRPALQRHGANVVP